MTDHSWKFMGVLLTKGASVKRPSMPTRYWLLGSTSVAAWTILFTTCTGSQLWVEVLLLMYDG